MTLRLNQARHEVDYDGSTTFHLNYIAGSREVNAEVRVSINDGTEVTIHREAETETDEKLHAAVREHAEEFVSEAGSVFGEVDR